MKEKNRGLIKHVVVKTQRGGNCGIFSDRLYGSKELIFKSSYSRQEAMETSREQFQPVLPSAGKAAREDRPEQARMLTSASASFRLQEAVHLPGGNVLSLLKGTSGSTTCF